MAVGNSVYMTADEAVILYNLRNTNQRYENDGQCRFPMCKEGKCICIDAQQAEVLKMVANDQIRKDGIERLRFGFNNESKLLFENATVPSTACSRGTVLGVTDSLCSFRKFPDSELKNFLRSIPANNHAYDSCLSLFVGLSIFFYINKKEELCDRDSVLYIALHGNDCNGVFLNLLFDSVTVSLIQKILKGEPIEPMVKAVENMCIRLQQIEESKRETIKDILEIADAFIKDINSAKLPVGIKLVDILYSYVDEENVLRQYRNTRGDDISKAESFNEKELSVIATKEANEKMKIDKVLPHYALMKSVFEASGQHVMWQKDFFLEKSLNKVKMLRDYNVSRIIEILKKVYSDPIKFSCRNEVLRKIETLLYEYERDEVENFDSESIEELEEIVKKCG